MWIFELSWSTRLWMQSLGCGSSSVLADCLMIETDAEDFVGLIFGVFNYGDSGHLAEQTPLCTVPRSCRMGAVQPSLIAGGIHHELIAFRTHEEGGQHQQSDMAKDLAKAWRREACPVQYHNTKKGNLAVEVVPLCQLLSQAQGPLVFCWSGVS